MVSLLLQSVPKAKYGFLFFSTRVGFIPRYGRDLPPSDEHLRQYNSQIDRMGDVLLSIPGVRPSPQVLTPANTCICITVVRGDVESFGRSTLFSHSMVSVLSLASRSIEEH
jgi:hypothetical protein